VIKILDNNTKLPANVKAETLVFMTASTPIPQAVASNPLA
jgi:hypothetical protein